MKGYIEHIVDNIKGSKSVIHIGAIGTSKKQLKRHEIFKKATGKIVGTDSKRELVNLAKSRGFKEIFLSDITNENDVNDIIKRYGTFEHIIFTDVLEHIGNMTIALDNIYKLMNDKSRLYISTPNVASSFFHNRFKVRRERNVKPRKHDHVCWFCENTLTTLLERSDLVPVYVQENDEKILFFIVKRRKK